MTNIKPEITGKLNKLNQSIALAKTSPGSSGNKFLDTAVMNAEELLVFLWTAQAELPCPAPAQQPDENQNRAAAVDSPRVSLNGGIARVKFPQRILSGQRHSSKFRKILSRLYFQELREELKAYTPPDRFICVIEPVYRRDSQQNRIPDHDNIAYRDFLNLICKAVGAEDGPQHCTGIVLSRWADEDEAEGTELVLLPFKEDFGPLRREFGLHDFIIGCATVAQPMSEEG